MDTTSPTGTSSPGTSSAKSLCGHHVLDGDVHGRDVLDADVLGRDIISTEELSQSVCLQLGGAFVDCRRLILSSTLCVCWAQADWPTASLFIQLM